MTASVDAADGDGDGGTRMALERLAALLDG
jgi:hypothetical protein